MSMVRFRSHPKKEHNKYQLILKKKSSNDNGAVCCLIKLPSVYVIKIFILPKCEFRDAAIF